MQNNLVIEIGGTWLRSGLYAGGSLSAVRKVATPIIGSSQERVVDLMDAIAVEVNRLVQINNGQIGPIGVSCAGIMRLRPKNGRRLQGPDTLISRDVLVESFDIGLHNFPLQAKIEQRFPHHPVLLENDTNSAAKGVIGYDNAIVLGMGTGVSAALVKDGRLIRPEGTWGAFEIGHEFADIVPQELRNIVPDGLRNDCRCGNSGCLEAVIGGWAIEQYGTTSQVVSDLATTIVDRMCEKYGVTNVLLNGTVANALRLAPALQLRLPRLFVEYTQFDHNSGLFGIGRIVDEASLRVSNPVLRLDQV